MVGGFLFLQEVAVAADDWKMVQRLNFKYCIIFWCFWGRPGKKNWDLIGRFLGLQI